MKDLHTRMVVHYIADKAGELEYLLRHLLTGASGSLRSFRERPTQGGDKGDTHAVIYWLSAFTNAIQSLKDAFTTGTGEALSWSTIHGLRHGQFFHDVRNASSHDGSAAAQLPEEVRGLFTTERTRVAETLRNSLYDPVQGAIERLTQVRSTVVNAKRDWDALVNNRPATPTS